jgi:hypothetical protein
MMSGEELALVRAVLCAPLSQARSPMLALAAWMQAHDEPERAEFLRLLPDWYDVVRTQGDRSAGWPARKRLVELEKHARLAPPFPGHGHPLPWLPTESPFNSWSDFEHRAAERFTALEEPIWRVSFDLRRKRRWQPQHVARLVRAPAMARVLDLDLGAIHVGARGAQAIAESSLLGNLGRLRLTACALDDAAAHALASSLTLPRLQVLEIEGNELGPSGEEALRARFGEA